jgi:bacterioferritin B
LRYFVGTPLNAPEVGPCLTRAKLWQEFARGRWAGGLTFVAPAQNLRGMLISQTLNDKINEQIGYEFAASIQYTAIASHFDAESLPFLARHFYKQADEEHEHAMKFIKFLIDAGARVEIPAVTKPIARFPFAEDAVKLSLEQEIKVTDLINNLMDTALRENNHIASTFLQWFVSEQLEEVSSMDQLLKIVQRAGEGRLLLVEQYLAGYKSARAISEKNDD